MMPVAGALFALDGVFFGAGDLAFLRRMTLIASLGASSCPLLIVAHVLDLGLGGIWAGIAAFIAVRMLLASAALALAPLARGGHADGRRGLNARIASPRGLP